MYVDYFFCVECSFHFNGLNSQCKVNAEYNMGVVPFLV